MCTRVNRHVKHAYRTHKYANLHNSTIHWLKHQTHTTHSYVSPLPHEKLVVQTVSPQNAIFKQTQAKLRCLTATASNLSEKQNYILFDCKCCFHISSIRVPARKVVRSVLGFAHSCLRHLLQTWWYCISSHCTHVQSSRHKSEATWRMGARICVCHIDRAHTCWIPERADNGTFMTTDEAFVNRNTWPSRSGTWLLTNTIKTALAPTKQHLIYTIEFNSTNAALKVAQGQLCIRLPRFSLVSIIPPLLCIHSSQTANQLRDWQRRHTTHVNT